MRRTTVYPGAVPLEVDLLNTNKQTMIAVGHVLQDMLGTGTLFSGLGCVPTGPAGMTVNVNPGRAYSLQATDTGAYSSLTADAHQIVKQGILLDLVNFACPAPTTAGFSINYLIQGAFQEIDAGSTVLPYYNAANPAVAFSGPNGTGTSNTTYRDNTVQLQLKPGAAATTGSQVTPTPDAGFNGLWVVTVAFGQTTITSANITQFAGAPFLTAPLLSQIQAPVPGRLLRTSVYFKTPAQGAGTQNVSVNGGTGTTTGATSFTPLAASSLIRIRVLAGGGGGGGTPGISADFGGAPGGGGGGYAESILAATSVPAGTAITVGAGGASNTGAAGGAGGSSSAGSLLSATGGAGGSLGGSGNTSAVLAGAPGGTGTGGNVVVGAGGAGGHAISFASVNSISGYGGSSVYGGGGGAVGGGGNTGGSSSVTPGSGGSGASTATGNVTPLFGGLGNSGLVIIEEWA